MKNIQAEQITPIPDTPFSLRHRENEEGHHQLELLDASSKSIAIGKLVNSDTVAKVDYDLVCYCAVWSIATAREYGAHVWEAKALVPY